MGGEAATPTSGAEGQDEAPRNRSAAEVSRSRRDWTSGCVSPTGARRDRPSGRPDEWREENAARGGESARSHIGRGVRSRSDAARRRAEGALGHVGERPGPRSQTADGGRPGTETETGTETGQGRFCSRLRKRSGGSKPVIRKTSSPPEITTTVGTPITPYSAIKA